MNQLNMQNNLNQLIDLKTSLLNDFNKQKNLVTNLQKIINIISSGIKELLPSLESYNNILPYIMSELGLPFCDLINETNIIKYYFDLYISNKSEVIKNILISFIQVFNFASSKKTPGDVLLEFLLSYDPIFKEIADKKRKTKTEIEEIYDTLNCIDSKLSLDEKTKLKNNLLNQVNEIEKKNTCSVSEIQYLKEKLNSIELNSTIIDTNNKPTSSNIFNDMNYLIRNFQIFETFEKNQNINNNIKNTTINSNTNDKIDKTKNITLRNTNDKIDKTKNITLQNREFLYKEEQLIDEENEEYVEFKNYSYPFSKEKIDELKRQYCGFLNNKGGFIYIGITELKIVKGIYLDYKGRDTIKNELVNYTYDFYPKCRIDKINVFFLPIKHTQTNSKINNLYVVKIIVMPGEPYNLYSINNKGGYISTFRLSKECINLSAEEIYSELMKRAQILKQKYINEENKISEIKENNEKEEINEEITEDEKINEGNIEENKDNNKKREKKVVYVVKITNIDKSLKIKDLNRYFNGCGSCKQKFPVKPCKLYYRKRSICFWSVYFD